MTMRKLFFVPLAALCVAAAGCSSNVAPPLGAVSVPTVATTSATSATIKKAGAAQNQKVVWSKNFEDAQAEAVKSHKPIMVDFYTDWCGACKMLDRDGYTNAGVIQQSQKFVMVKVDAEKRQDLALRFKVTGYPTLLWLDADGNILNSSPGYGGVEMLQNDMTTALHKFSATV